MSPLSRSTGMVSTLFNHHEVSGLFHRVLRAKKRIWREIFEPTMGGSRWLAWFDAMRNGPSVGKFSIPTTSPRNHMPYTVRAK